MSQLGYWSFHYRQNVRPFQTVWCILIRVCSICNVKYTGVINKFVDKCDNLKTSKDEIKCANYINTGLFFNLHPKLYANLTSIRPLMRFEVDRGSKSAASQRLQNNIFLFQAPVFSCY